MKRLLVAGLAVLALQNPSTIRCEVHNVNFVRMGQAFPSGKCFDVYKHSYNEGLRVKTHEAWMPCREGAAP